MKFSPLWKRSVGLALVGIVLWGTLVGSMLPFALRRFGFDPATSSAPFVATLVDVTGLIIYFSVGMSCPGLNFDASVSVVTVITSI